MPQYLYDSSGNITHVYLPIDEWNELLKNYPEIENRIGNSTTQLELKIINPEKEAFVLELLLTLQQAGALTVLRCNGKTILPEELENKVTESRLKQANKLLQQNARLKDK
ncbi:MAG: hypothetical protein IPJ81_08680 [Chitinophagaceae bacterium]|nr:hypothetical protein [Chitinophagaceae bacterium]